MATNSRSGSFTSAWIVATTGQGHAEVQLRQSPLGVTPVFDQQPADDGDQVLVRDSKDRTAPALTFSAAAWRAFLTTLTR